MKGYYCKIDKRNTTGQRDFLHVFAHEFCLEGFNYRAGDAVNFVIGQGDTMVTPLQLARAYGALSNGGKLMAPQVAKAVVSPDGKLIRKIKPKVIRRVKSSKAALAYVDKVPTAGDIRRLYLGRDAMAALTQAIAARRAVSLMLSIFVANSTTNCSRSWRI